MQRARLPSSLQVVTHLWTVNLHDQYTLWLYYLHLITIYLSSLGPVYLSLGTVNPMITTNNTNILITTIGEDVDSLPVLTCHTDLVECCRGSDHPGTGGLGNWFNPNGDMLTNEGDGGDFYIRRNDAQLIRLNRRRSATSPVGLYCCVIPTTIGEQIFCANLGNLVRIMLCYSVVKISNCFFIAR